MNLLVQWPVALKAILAAKVGGSQAPLLADGAAHGRRLTADTAVHDCSVHRASSQTGTSS